MTTHITTYTEDLAEGKVDGTTMERRRAAKVANSAETLALLAADEKLTVRKNVAYNPATPEATLLLLASDAEVAVRRAVAKSDAMTPTLASLLAADDDIQVKENLASNPLTPFDVLRVLHLKGVAVRREGTASTAPLQSDTAIGQKFEQANRDREAEYTLEEKMNAFPIRPSSMETLLALKEARGFSHLNFAFAEGGYAHRFLVMSHREKYAFLPFEEWVEQVFRDLIPYASFFALAMRTARELHLSPQFALDVLYIRYFVESEEGFRTEDRSQPLAYENLVATGQCSSVRKALKSEDHVLHIDLVALNGKEHHSAYQIKPDTFLVINRYIRHAQIENLYGNHLYTKKHNAPVFYLVKSDIEAGVWNPLPIEEVMKRCFGDEIPEELQGENLLPF